MSQPTFVDASAWIAFINCRDVHHRSAAQIYRSLITQDAPLIVTNWVAYEALSFVRGRLGYAAARALNEILFDRELVWWESVTSEIEAEALRVFWQYDDKDWGIVDCSSFVIMRLLNCQQAFGYDYHFVEAARQSGFKLLGKAG